MKAYSFLGNEFYLLDYVIPITNLERVGIRNIEGGYIEDIFYINGCAYLTLTDIEDNIILEDVLSKLFVREIEKKDLNNEEVDDFIIKLIKK